MGAESVPVGDSVSLVLQTAAIQPRVIEVARTRVLLVVVFAIGFVSQVPVGTASSANVSITSVSTTPESPVPGDTVTIRSTIENPVGSATSVDIERVVVRRSEGAYREVAEATDLGTLGSGSSLTVPLTASFDETGLKRLRIHLYGEAANGSSVHVQRPVVVRVSDQYPLLDVSLNETVTGTT